MNKNEMREQLLTYQQNIYQGKYLRNMRHGQGRLDMADGQAYAGSFQMGMRSGFGVNTYKDGSVYEGAWDKDKPCGQGVLTTAEGNKIYAVFDGLSAKNHAKILYITGEEYSGDILQLKPHGFGRVVYLDGSVYDGTFQNGQMDGNGVWSGGNGEIYRGQFKNGMRHGVGTLIDLQGEYEGQFVDDHREGSGVQVYRDLKFGYSRPQSGFVTCQKTIYRGQFKRDKKQGEGIMEYADGTIYTGQFFNDKRNGTGKIKLHNREITGQFTDDALNQNDTTIQYLNGDSYQGQTLNGNPHGTGELHYQNGSIFIGHLQNMNLLQGVLIQTNEQFEGTFELNKPKKGKLTTPQSVYEGEFKNGRKNGHGTETTATEKYTGQFMNDVKHGTGTQTDLNQNVYTGVFKNGLRNGPGTLKMKDGSVFEGEWHMNNLCGDGQMIGGIAQYNESPTRFGLKCVNDDSLIKNETKMKQLQKFTEVKLSSLMRLTSASSNGRVSQLDQRVKSAKLVMGQRPTSQLK
ncbi:Membrane_occupation and recognition nexus (Morn) repeat protein [Hexamita inflata]|uniref:Membrane occupation and recognition nexus (Morn) repeat protein n=1 Tax=Hexamita inflata TaxID=28002 RepID=A0AA86QAY1_9EUKA|nr:Membrane occupation and recognition nexus (Morn) repeat protein [Hexamita inflata]